MKAVYIVEAKRSAIGSFGGSLKDTPPAALGTTVVQGMMQQLPDELRVQELYAGNVLGAGHGMNIARQVLLGAGLPEAAPATTINNVCGSGLKAVCLAASAIQGGERDCVIAGGVESMSQTGFINLSQRWGQKMGPVSMQDLMVHDGLTDVFHQCHMGVTAENLAERYEIARDMQDAFALESQQKAYKAQQAGLFAEEIVPIPLMKRGKPAGEFSHDEYVRADASLDSLSGLRAVFKKEGTVTAGNASGINDGAAFLCLASEEAVKQHALKPIAKILGWHHAGVAPDVMGIGPVEAVRGLCKSLSCSVDDFDAIESNEAFAAQALAVQKELQLPEDRVNTRGGAIALGHPIGASGARILVSLLYRLRSGEGERGLATLCVGGGQGVALAVTTAV